MREIKFRVWDGATMYMPDETSWDDIHLYLDGTLNEVSRTGYYQTVDVCLFKGAVIMQYTGLKDKNGVEIYEDDILKCEDEDIEYCLVEWDNHKACFSINYYGYDVYSNENSGEETMNSISCLDSYLLTDSELENTEVIGNIHQHPHLLK